jgi:hypothetical protein
LLPEKFERSLHVPEGLCGGLVVLVELKSLFEACCCLLVPTLPPKDETEVQIRFIDGSRGAMDADRVSRAENRLRDSLVQTLPKLRSCVTAAAIIDDACAARAQDLAWSWSCLRIGTSF